MYSFELVEELVEHMKTAQQKTLKNEGCIKLNDVYSKFIGLKEYYQVCELEKFLNNHLDISEEDFEIILMGNVFHFAFLNKLNDFSQSLYNDVKIHGAKYVIKDYVANVITENIANL